MSNGWSNDFSDINNLNKTLGGNSQADKNPKKDDGRFIDIFYPFNHTARIEQLFVMETTSKDPLPKNLVTASERNEFIEIGFRYGFKEGAIMVLLFLVFVIVQFATTMKVPSQDTSAITNGLLLSSLVSLAYGVAYSIHITKYDVGILTSKTINSLLAGRFAVVAIIMLSVGWALWALQTYVYSDPSAILKWAVAVVPSKEGGGYDIAATGFSFVMIPFGGSFPVTEWSVAYSLTVLIPELFSSWWLLSIIAMVSVIAPIVIAAIHKKTSSISEGRAQTELDNY